MYSCVLPSVTVVSRSPILFLSPVKLSGRYCQQRPIYFRLSICCFLLASFLRYPIFPTLSLLQVSSFFGNTGQWEERLDTKSGILYNSESRKINVFSSNTIESYLFLFYRAVNCCKLPTLYFLSRWHSANPFWYELDYAGLWCWQTAEYKHQYSDLLQRILPI